MATEDFSISGMVDDLRAEKAARDQRMRDGIFNLQLQQEQDYEGASGINAFRTQDTVESPGEDVLANAQLSMNRHLTSINQGVDADYLTKNPDLSKYIIGDLDTQKFNFLQSALNENQLALSSQLEQKDPEKYKKIFDEQKKIVDEFTEKYSNPDILTDQKEAIKDREETQLAEIEKLFADDDSSFQKKLALAQFGLALAGGRSMGGKPFPIVAEAGQQLIQNLAQINAAKKKDAKEKAVAILGVKSKTADALVNAEQQFKADVQSMEWNSITQNYQNASNLATLTAEMDQENMSVISENNRQFLEKNFDLFSNYITDKYQATPGVVQFIDENGNTINVKGRQTKGGTIEFATGQVGPRGNEIYASISSQANVPGFGRVNQFLDKKTVDQETIKIGDTLSNRYKTFKITNDVLDTIAAQPESVGPAGAINLLKSRLGSALNDLGFSFGGTKDQARATAEAYRTQIENSDLDEETKKRLLKSTDFNKIYREAEKRIKARTPGKVDADTLESLAVAETTLVYALANSFKDKDRLTARDVAAAEKLVNLFTLTRGSKTVEASIRAIGKQLQDDIIRYENDYRRVGGLERTLQNMRVQNQFRLQKGETVTDAFLKGLDEAGLLQEFNK